MPVSWCSDRLEYLTRRFRCLGCIQHELRPAARRRLVREDINQRFRNSLAAMIVVHVDVITLSGPEAGNRFGQVVEDQKADQRAVDESTHELG